MESPVHAAVTDPPCRTCGAAAASKTHVHNCVRERLDALRYAELFWEEA